MNKSVTPLKCDCCEKVYDDIFEIQEFLKFEDVGGYASIIGDMTHWSINLCQHCVVTKLGRYITIEEH